MKRRDWFHCAAVGLLAVLNIVVGANALLHGQASGLASVWAGLSCGVIAVLLYRARQKAVAQQAAAPPTSAHALREANARATEVLRGYVGRDCDADRFLVPSPTIPGRHYSVSTHNKLVFVYQDGRRVMYLCVQPLRYLPDADIALMHKLWIEADEQQYLATAHKWYCGRYTEESHKMERSR